MILFTRQANQKILSFALSQPFHSGINSGRRIQFGQSGNESTGVRRASKD